MEKKCEKRLLLFFFFFLIVYTRTIHIPTQYCNIRSSVMSAHCPLKSSRSLITVEMFNTRRTTTKTDAHRVDNYTLCNGNNRPEHSPHDCIVYSNHRISKGGFFYTPTAYSVVFRYLFIVFLPRRTHGNNNNIIIMNCEKFQVFSRKNVGTDEPTARNVSMRGAHICWTPFRKMYSP